jgi:hypothetical protein
MSRSCKDKFTEILQMTPEPAWIFAVSLAPCKAEAQFGQLPSPRAAPHPAARAAQVTTAVRLSCRTAGKAKECTGNRESSGEYRLICLPRNLYSSTLACKRFIREKCRPMIFKYMNACLPISTSSGAIP